MFHAIRNQGAFLNDKQICTSSLQDLSQALVLTDWGGDRNPSVLDIKSSNIRQIISKVRGVRTMGSAALHMCQIAAGNGDIFFEFGIHCWDYAAAVLIVREAGGYCCNFDDCDWQVESNTRVSSYLGLIGWMYLQREDTSLF
ncbi:Inositol monophosphatase 2 [Schistosoma japonicum]|nr:Inositol monophosphatase 2 [Schistosoma japonicum]